MTDETAPSPSESKTLRDTNLYQIATREKLLAFLEPNLMLQAAFEEEVSESFPREDDDDKDTRIIIFYTNAKGNAVVFKLTDHLRLDNTFDLNGFMAGLMDVLDEGKASDDVIQKIDGALATTLNLALGTALGIDQDGRMNKRKRELSEKIIKSICSIVFNDPLDVAISVLERKLQGEEESSQSVMTGLWALKKRPEEVEAE